MFDFLSRKIGAVWDALRGRKIISEDDLNAALRQIRVALLEADVNLNVAKELMNKISEKAVGENVLKSVSPTDMVIKIVNDEITAMLGEKNEELSLTGAKPVSILMLGLQGSGKTTSSAKLAYFLSKKEGKKVLLASTDIYRPAAREQLEILARQIEVTSLPIAKDEKVMEIAKRAAKIAKDENYDVLIVDTAGRLQIDELLMNEAKELADFLKPTEKLLVVDAKLGQEGVNVAREFNEKIGVSGIIISGMDGDARGGAALSMRAVTNAPVKFLGVGEKPEALEAFYPDRLASRILGMGDIVSLVEQAQEKLDKEQTQKLAERMMEGKFDFNDMLEQFKQMKKIGSLGGILKLLPGVGGLQEKLKAAGVDDNLIKRQQAIILSMTKKERANPNLLLQSRKKRIAAGAGTSLSEVEKLIKQYEKASDAMKRMQKMGGMQAMMEQMQKEAEQQS